jgi:hypothetical protein
LRQNGKLNLRNEILKMSIAVTALIHNDDIGCVVRSNG